MSVVPAIDQLKGAVLGGTPIEQLGAAATLAERLHARGDELLDEFVNGAQRIELDGDRLRTRDQQASRARTIRGAR